MKRKGGIIIDGPVKKSNKIEFVKTGHATQTEAKSDDEGDASEEKILTKPKTKEAGQDTTESESTEVKEIERIDYMAEMSQVKCLDVRKFRHNMFATRFGKFVLLARSWTGKLWNIQCEYGFNIII